MSNNLDSDQQAFNSNSNEESSDDTLFVKEASKSKSKRKALAKKSTKKLVKKLVKKRLTPDPKDSDSSEPMYTAPPEALLLAF